MPKTKVEVYDKDQLIYPFIESDHVTFSNGMKVTEMLDQSISMPTVTHEDLSFKVGVGDQDVSSAIVDSSVSKMVIKGQTYQNILPEPSTHVLTNNKEMFKVNEGLDPNVEIVDGVSKSAILKGQTLVNNIKRITTTSGYTTIHNNGIGFTIDTKGETTTSRRSFTLSCNKITPGAKYTVIVDVVENTITRGSDSTQVLKIVLNNYNQMNNGYVQINVGETGLRVFEVIAPTTVTSENPYIETPSDINGKLIVNGISIIEGHNHNLTGFIEGMQSVKAPVLCTIGKNLFDAKLHKGLVNQGDYYSVNETQAASNNVEYRVEPNTQYTLSFDKYGTSSCWVGVDIDGVYSNNNNENYSKTFTTNATGKTTIRIGANGVNDKGHTISNIMLRKVNDDGIYEQYKTNILSTPEEVVLRSLPNGVKDTLNLNTGEYVKRIGEVVLNGSENWGNAPSYINGNPRFCYDCSNLKARNNVGNQLVLTNSDTIISVPSDVPKSATKGFSPQYSYTNSYIYTIERDWGTTPSNFKTYLQQNPVTVQYELETPIVKTVNLSTSGNWEKVVLNGSENWTQSTVNNNYFMETSVIKSNYNTGTENLVFSGDHRLSITKIYTSNTNTGLCIEKGGGLRIRTQQVLRGQTIEDFKAYLSQNPVMVYYQTKNHQDSTQVKQPIFFKDGHIQLSSEADNSLIPTLDYQAKTSNSYVMDLMKTNTRYTMKAKSASGTFTIDGTSYGAGTNGTFTTPSSMTNKFLVMSNKTNEEVMILEGDVVSKTIPYFKGIKSAFEGEDKIEVLSTGKNLYPYGDSTYIPEYNGWYFVNGDRQTRWGESVHKDCGQGAWFYLDEGRYYFSVVNNNNVQTLQVIGDKEQLYGDGKLIPSGWYTLRMSVKNANEEVNIANIMVEKDTKTTYEPHKSNSTKIPLLSPLRSLPNGMCDEIILDRENNKAKIIQRIGKVEYDGTDVWGTYTVHQNNVRIQTTLPNCVRRDTADFIYAICDKLPSVIWNYSWLQNYNLVTVNLTNLHLQLSDTTMTKQQMLSWLTQNPITVYYELETPVITEVDLEGFPYIYKDGHIFLNSEIVPTTEIIYSINQCQQISASNEDIIRHEKELTYLQKLIAQYVQVDYESVLLSLKV